MSEHLEERVQALRRRIQELSAVVSGSPGGDGGPDPSAMKELTAAIAELFDVADDLSTRSDALIRDRASADEERRHFEALFEAGPAASLVTDQTAEITAVNEPAAELLGDAAGNLRGESLTAYLDPASQVTIFLLMTRARGNPRQASRGEVVLRPYSGQARLVTAVVSIAADAEGTTEFRWLLDEGISSRPYEALTPTEQELRSTAVRLEGILDSVSDGIVSVDHDQRIIVYNQAAERIFGWSAAEVIGQDVGALVPAAVGDRHAGFLAEFARMPGGPKPMSDRGPIAAARKDGQTFYADITISRTQVDSRWIATAVVRDVSHELEEVREVPRGRGVQPPHHRHARGPRRGPRPRAADPGVQQGLRTGHRLPGRGGGGP